MILPLIVFYSATIAWEVTVSQLWKMPDSDLVDAKTLRQLLDVTAAELTMLGRHPRNPLPKPDKVGDFGARFWRASTIRHWLSGFLADAAD